MYILGRFGILEEIMPKGKRKGKSGEYHALRPWSGNRSLWPMSPRFASNTICSFVTYGTHSNVHMMNEVVRNCGFWILFPLMNETSNQFCFSSN